MKRNRMTVEEKQAEDTLRRRMALATAAARRGGAEQAEAESIAYDTILKLEAREGREDRPEKPDVWLATVAFNRAQKGKRRERHRQRLLNISPSLEGARRTRARPGQAADRLVDGGLPDVAGGVSDEWGRAESLGSLVGNKRVLTDLLDSLEPDDRFLIEQYYGAGIPAADLAEMLGVRTDALYKRAERLRKKIRAEHGDAIAVALDRSNDRGRTRGGAAWG